MQVRGRRRTGCVPAVTCTRPEAVAGKGCRRQPQDTAPLGLSNAAPLALLPPALAVSRGKQLGLTAHYLPAGILVTVFSRPQLPQTVAPRIELICDQLRQP